MFREQPETYEALFSQPRWPVSQMYHENSKLGDHTGQAFCEQIASFGQDVEAVRQSTQSFKVYPTRQEIPLNRAPRFGGRRLRDLLRTRRTRRAEFSDQPVSLRQWGILLDMACGLTGRIAHPQFPDMVQELRAWPSGGALYPIEVYLAVLRSDELTRSFHHFQPRTHSLACLDPCPSPKELEAMIFAEGLWENASALFVLTGVFARTQIKYGERGYRFVLLDAGHLAQNVLLACEDLGLAAIPLGGFDDNRLASVLALDPEQEAPLYAILIGTRRRGARP